MMDGEIGVESDPGKGSTFWFAVSLPRQAQADSALLPEAPCMPAIDRLRQECPQMHVLVAEDEPISREVIGFLLEDASITFDLAVDGEQAVHRASQRPYDLILMDMQMPNLSGIEATRMIRAGTCNRETPILAMTANAYPEDRQRCLEAGMNEHLAKPIDPDALYELLLRHHMSDSKRINAA